MFFKTDSVGNLRFIDALAGDEKLYNEISPINLGNGI